MLMTQKFIFSGRVQGVFFRATSKDLAEGLGISGTVRNLSDGSVELVAQGTQEALFKLENELLKAFHCYVAQKGAVDHAPFSGFTILW